MAALLNIDDSPTNVGLTAFSKQEVSTSSPSASSHRRLNLRMNEPRLSGCVQGEIVQEASAREAGSRPYSPTCPATPQRTTQSPTSSNDDAERKTKHAADQRVGRCREDNSFRDLELALMRLGWKGEASHKQNSLGERKCTKYSILSGGIRHLAIMASIVKTLEQRGQFEDVVQDVIQNSFNQAEEGDLADLIEPEELTRLLQRMMSRD